MGLLLTLRGRERGGGAIANSTGPREDGVGRGMPNYSLSPSKWFLRHYLKMGCDESHFNLSFTVKVIKKTVTPPQTTTFEEKGKPKRNGTEVGHSAQLPA